MLKNFTACDCVCMRAVIALHSTDGSLPLGKVSIKSVLASLHFPETTPTRYHVITETLLYTVHL